MFLLIKQNDHTPAHLIRNLLDFYFVLQHYVDMSGRQACFRWPRKAIRPRPETHLTGARIAPFFSPLKRS